MRAEWSHLQILLGGGGIFGSGKLGVKVVLKVQQPKSVSPSPNAPQIHSSPPEKCLPGCCGSIFACQILKQGVVLKVAAGRGGWTRAVCAPCRAAGQAKAGASSNVDVNNLR